MAKNKFSVESALEKVSVPGVKIKEDTKTIHVESGALGLKRLGALDFLKKYGKYHVVFSH